MPSTTRNKMVAPCEESVISVCTEETVGMEHNARRITMGPAIRGQHCHTNGNRFHRPAWGGRPRYMCTFHSVESKLAILYKSVYMYVYICIYIYSNIQIHIRLSASAVGALRRTVQTINWCCELRTCKRGTMLGTEMGACCSLPHFPHAVVAQLWASSCKHWTAHE